MMPDTLFWRMVNKHGPVAPRLRTRCWVWMGNTTNGYGRVKRGGRNLVAHRVSYAAVHGEPPPGKKMQIDHLCRNRACVNPRHLELVTARENVMRGERWNKLGEMHAAKTHCPHGHPYTKANTQVDMHGGTPRRRCRACRRAMNKRARENKK